MPKPAPVYSIELLFRPERDNYYVHFENAGKHSFQPDPRDFPRVNAWWLADAALLSYWEPALAKAIFERAGLQSEFVKEGSTDCYVAWQDAFVIVVFRGTESNEWDDVLTDAKIELVPWKVSGNVHRGFNEAIITIWKRLGPLLNELSRGRTVWFCGHSLGAALAVLAADLFGDTRGICTIGCPRVGDDKFAVAFNEKLGMRSLRYVNHADAVAHVPLEIMGYHHVVEPRFIEADGTISRATSIFVQYFPELVGSPDILLEIIKALIDGRLRRAPRFVLDHMPKAYAIWMWNDYEKNG